MPGAYAGPSCEVELLPRVGRERQACAIVAPGHDTCRFTAGCGIALAAIRTMPTTDPRQSLGKLGERLACDELERRGYSILATRHRTRFGEIDIVCTRGGSV